MNNIPSLNCLEILVNVNERRYQANRLNILAVSQHSNRHRSLTPDNLQGKQELPRQENVNSNCSDRSSIILLRLTRDEFNRLRETEIGLKRRLRPIEYKVYPHTSCKAISSTVKQKHQRSVQFMAKVGEGMHVACMAFSLSFNYQRIYSLPKVFYVWCEHDLLL